MALAIHHTRDSLIAASEENRSPAAELPGFDSPAVEEEMLAFQHEFPLPSIAHLLKNAEQLLFLAYSARHGGAEEAEVYGLLETFSRYRGENANLFREIGAAAQHLAGHLRAASAHLAEGEELGAFHELQACRQAGASMRMFSKEGWNRFGGMAELTSYLLENLTGQKWGLKENAGFRPASEKTWEFEAWGTFMAEQDGIWRRCKLAKKHFAEAKDTYLHDFHVTREMEKAERDRNGLAVIPLMFRAFNATAAPAATAFKGEGRDAWKAWQALERLVSFSECRLALLEGVAGQITLIEGAARAGDFRGAAIRALAAAVPVFQEIANIIEDFYEFCDELDNGHYLSLLPHVRLDSMLMDVQERSREERRKFYARPPVARAAFGSMARIQAIARLCGEYCARHEREFSDSLKALSAMSEEERRPLTLAAILAESFQNETVAEAMLNHARLLERQERILAALPPESGEARP